MKVWKVVSGIISIVLFVIGIIQVCAFGPVSGMAIFVTIMLVAAGVVSIFLRKSRFVGNIILIILYALGAIFGFLVHGTFMDFLIWAIWSVVCVILSIISMVSDN
mgnify:CR=1 FL=1